MTITIKLKTTDDAFTLSPDMEVYRILRILTERVSEGGLHFLPGNVMDSNGNTVGTVKVTGR